MKMPSDLTFFITLLSLVGNGIAARQFRSVFFTNQQKKHRQYLTGPTFFRLKQKRLPFFCGSLFWLRS